MIAFSVYRTQVSDISFLRIFIFEKFHFNFMSIHSIPSHFGVNVVKKAVRIKRILIEDRTNQYCFSQTYIIDFRSLAHEFTARKF
jgi:hypothetical protein